jgi:hypothetical protein
MLKKTKDLKNKTPEDYAQESKDPDMQALFKSNHLKLGK